MVREGWWALGPRDLEGGVGGEAAAEAGVEELEGLIDGVEGEVAGGSGVGLGVEGSAHRVVDVGGFFGDLSEVAGDVEDLGGRCGVALEGGPVGPAVLELW